MKTAGKKTGEGRQELQKNTRQRMKTTGKKKKTGELQKNTIQGANTVGEKKLSTGSSIKV
jgi:hypothetical protein